MFAPVLAVLGLAVVLLGLVYGLNLLLAGRSRQVTAPFLAGGLPAEHAVSRFHVRWYPATLLFLAFDMEMVFMYPWAVVVAEHGTPAVVEMFGFLAVLFLGVLYVWREGGLRWA
ncbi:NADH-quinone oxidoreductase subunit A [Amycolatopsis aidingensis]|uniref:NADH-quinone oxidoreductase subunit A n=1 Tax=Amycolatopsis aidingensis TaxID=2842453 RepID=UPI001C0C7CDA|nr:NADH-quinone oxidoreductase subunit A [Amycolatopsis aidingensis]